MSPLTLIQESQSDYATLPELVRSAVLGIGDRLLGVRATLKAVEPTWETEAGHDDALVSLVAFAVHDAIDPHLELLGRELGFDRPGQWSAASRFFHARFGELVDLSPLASRCYRKPLGYAGDFEMMNMIYRNESLGETLFGRALSRIVLDADGGQAVRNRVSYLTEKIKATIMRTAVCGLTPADRSAGVCLHSEPGQPARLLSVAGGPAVEIQHLLRTEPELLRADRAEIALLDQDASALRHAREQIETLAAHAGIEIKLRCINTAIRTVIADGLTGSYDLIYSAGLFDCLKDRTARAAGARMVAALAPDGQAVIGNFDPSNATRPFQELILDWPLLHRTAGDLRRIFDGLGADMTVEKEPTGVNLFAVISA